MDFLPLFKPQPRMTGQQKAFWIIVSGTGRTAKILMHRGNSSLRFPLFECSSDSRPLIQADKKNRFLIGRLKGLPCIAAPVEAPGELPEDLSFVLVRDLFGILQKAQLAALSRGIEILHWDSINRFCGRCGQPMKNHGTEPAKQCGSCGNIVYPRISPAIIVLIKKDDTILLAHNDRFPESLYSCVAGFVDPGENLEEAAAREIKEEVGLSVKNIRYFHSQSWPFPNTLMIGFTADYAGGEITPDGIEITDARWFSREELPQLPMKGSISRKLIDSMD